MERKERDKRRNDIILPTLGPYRVEQFELSGSDDRFSCSSFAYFSSLRIISLLPIQTMIGSIGVRMMIDWVYRRLRSRGG